MEQLEAAVGLLRELVKCLSGIRRGDQNRVRLVQLEKKLALRSKLVAMECEVYEKEKSKQEELERQERAEERRKKSGLSDKGKIHLIRGRMFGPEGVIKDREEELKRLEKDLKILKTKFGMSESSEKSTVHSPSAFDRRWRDEWSKVNRMRNAECGMGEASSKLRPPSQRYGATGVASSNVASAAPSGCEPIRVDTSACDQSAAKNVGNGGHGKNAPAQKGNDAAKEFDPVGVGGELERIGKGLEALRAGEKVEFDLVAAERDLERIGKGLKVALGAQEPRRVI